MLVQTEDKNQSIHPRVVNGRTKYAKVNTCGTPNPDKKARVAKSIAGHMKRHPRDSVQASRLAKL